MIISPRGEVIVEAAEHPQIIRHCVDLGAVRDAYVMQQRSDVVAMEYRAGR